MAWAGGRKEMRLVGDVGDTRSLRFWSIVVESLEGFI
jgi:hypothetical protein